MLPKKKRLPLRKELHAFKAAARKSTSPHLILYRSPAPSPQFAAIISKKSLPLSSHRNQLKRILLSELANSNMESLLVVVKPFPFSRSQFSEVLNELTSLLRAEDNADNV